MNDIVFSFGNVSKHFGDTKAVHDLTFQVGKGEVVGFVGPNGAGKTTAISMLLGFINTTKGTITIGRNSREVSPSNAHIFHKNIGFVSGDMELYGNLTGQQYLRFLGKRLGVDVSRQEELLQRLKPKMNARLKTLSRGNKQKIALVGALQHNPSILVLDEPTSGLDPLMQDTFLSIIGEQAARGTTVFMSSHILSEVASACSRVLFMKNGRIIIDKKIEEIERNSGKVVEIQAEPYVITASKKQLPNGAQPLSVSSKSLSFTYRGDMPALLRWLSSRQVKDVSIEERSLDDIFMNMYKDDERKEQS